MGRFEVDRKGLAKLLEKKGKAWILHELIQNAWDEDGVTRVDVTLHAIPGKPEARIVVEDDAPEGFKDLSHAFTLFAESYKKADPEKRGRFNVGEKLVLALASWAEIATTKGTVVFEGEERKHLSRKTDKGSRVTVLVRMTHAETAEVHAGVRALIPPAGIATTYNGEPLKMRIPVVEFDWTLQTEISDGDGVIRSSERKTAVRLYTPLPDETPTLYEKGIPVVETGDKWHVDVQQKVPLTMDRDNVRPAYLRAIRTFALNAMHEKLDPDDFVTPWVAQAVNDKRVEVAAVGSYLDAKYGKDRVINDPSSPESVSRAQSAGFAVIQGGSEARQTWDKIKAGGLAKPAGQEFPIGVETVASWLPEEKWTPGIKNIVAYAHALAVEILDCGIKVSVANDSTLGLLACYGRRHLTLNVGRLGYAWFNNGPSVEVNDLLIHEFGHHYEANHLSSAYHNALTRLGAQMVHLALYKPHFFAPFK